MMIINPNNSPRIYHTLAVSLLSLILFPRYSEQSCVASPGYYCPSVVGEPIRCLRGFYCPDGNGMIPCPVNTYNANDGGNALSSCQQCTTRTVTSGTGFTQCSVCSAGTFYNDVGGVKQCTTCPSGQSSIADSDSCSSCLVGHYSEAQTCSICKPGTYQDTPGAASCKACPDGTYTYSSNTSASGAAIFLPQWGAVSLDQCINLPTFGAPLVCLPGTYMTAGNCLPCPIGYYCPSMQISANDASAIRICPGGTMSKQKGAISQNDCTEVSLLQDYKFNNCKLADGDTQVLDPLTVTSSVTSKSTGTLYFTTATAIYRVFLLKTTSSLELLAGDATTAATNGDVSNGLNVRFTSLNAIAVDYDANEATLVVVADNNAIRMVNVFTKEVTLLGNKGDVHQAGGIALQKDAQGAKKAYVSDVTNNRIMVFDMQNLQSNLVAGSISGFPGAVDASFSYASFKSPRGLAFLEKNLNAAKLLLVADSGNGKIRVIDTQTRNVNTWFSPLDRTTPELTAPTSINVALISPDSSSTPLIYVVDAGKVKVIQFPLSSDSTVKVISSVSLAPGVTMTFQNAIPYGKPNIFNNVVVGFPNLIILDGVNKKIRAFVEQGISGTPATCHLSCEDTSCGELTVAKLCGNSFLDTVGEFSEQCDDGGANLGGCNQGTCAINDGYACPKPLTHCLNPCQAYTYEPTGVKYCPQDCLTLTPRSGFTIDAECKEHDIDECALGTATCGPQAICDNKPGTYTCKCLSTFFGDGVNCVGSAYAVYSIVDLPTTYPSPVFTNALSNPDASGSKNTLNALEVLKNKYAAMLTTFLPESMRVAVGFSMNTTQLAMGYTYVSVDPVYKLKTRMELVSLFPTVEIAQEAAAKTTQSGALADSLSRAFFNDSSVMTVFQQPKVRKHTSYSFTNPNTIEAWGMNITGVNYNRTCVVSGVTPTGGCWQVEMIYVGGAALPNPDENPAVEIPQSKNVLYLPRIDHNPDTMELLNPSQALTESSGIAFPCSTTSSSVVGLGINKQATACCFRDFNAMYRPHAGFADFLASSDFTSGAPEGYCNSQNVFNDTYPSSSVVYTNPGAGEGATNDLVVGKIQGMPHSEVRLLETIDYTTRTFRVLLVLEEGDLRQSASTIKGTLGLDYNLTFFVGLANFKGTGTSVVNTKNMQQFITVSKSNMLTISSYGANQDPLVTISDMQLNRIKVADFFQPIKYLYYLQAYFQMPQNFKVLAGGSGIVPLDSIRVIKTKDIPTASDPRWMQACASADGKFIYANSSLQQLVATAQASTCVKDYLQMCAPPQTVNQVVTFGIPLPQDLISDSDLTAFPPYSLQLQFMVQAFDTDARGNVLTSLSMSVDLSSLGMKRMCESITASQSLADIVSGNIYIGTAANDYEWTTTLQKKVNMDVPGAGKPSNSFEFQTVTVQGSVMTFTALGDPNYFLDARATSQSININDIYSVNFLEPLGGKTGTSPNFEKVKALFLNGSAFDLKTDPVNHIAWLQPSKALLDICPLRPTSGHMICLTRVHSTISNNTLKRDVKDVVEIRPGEASSIQEMKGLMGHVMLQGGTNGFTDMLGTNFSNQLINKLNLNNRFRKAYVLNPLVDWSYQAMQESQPQSTAYTVCTKIIAIGLITVNSGTGGGQLARRLLSTSMDLNPSSISEPSYFAIQSNPTSMGRALLQVSPALNSGILAPTSTQSANSLVVNLDIPGYDSVTHLCEILLGVSYDKCNVLQFHNLLIGSKASELCSSHSDGVLGDTLTNTFSNVLRDPNGLSQIVGVFVLDYSLQGCENLIPSINPNAPQSRRLLQTGDVVNDFIVSMKTNILIGNMNGTSILSLNRMDELGKWLNTTIFPNIVSGGGFVTALELVYKPGTDGKIGGVQVVIHLNNSSSVNTTFLQEKLKSIAGGDKITDIMFSDGTTTFTTQKSSASSSRKTLPYYLILLINTLTLLSISALFSGVEYKLS